MAACEKQAVTKDLSKTLQELTSFPGHLSQEDELVITGRHFYSFTQVRAANNMVSNRRRRKELIVASGGNPQRAFYNKAAFMDAPFNDLGGPYCTQFEQNLLVVKSKSVPAEFEWQKKVISSGFSFALQRRERDKLFISVTVGHQQRALLFSSFRVLARHQRHALGANISQFAGCEAEPIRSAHLPIIDPPSRQPETQPNHQGNALNGALGKPSLHMQK